MPSVRLPVVAVFLVVLLAAMPATASSVAMYGDFRVQGTFFQNQNYTGWNPAGTQTEDTLTLWQRMRLHVDLAAGEHLAFRLGLRVNNEAWGHGTLTAANPTTAIEPYQGYLQFTVPDTRVTVTAGYQPLSLPHTPVFYDSVVLGADSGNSDVAALVLNAPLADDVLSAQLGYGRLIDTNRTYDTTTTQVDDEVDLAFVTLPLTVPGFKATPWGAVGIIGRGASLPDGIADNLLSAGSFLTPTGYGQNQNAALWTGAALTSDNLAPVTLYADVIHGDAGFSGRARCRRQGWFADMAVEYTGLDWVTPQVLGWWGSGENKSLTDGSERLPALTPAWGPRGSFLFNADQSLTKASMNTTPQGSTGVVLNFDHISLLPKLTTLVAFSYATGTNSPAGLRQAVAVTGGSGAYVTMGQDLAEGEYLVSAAWEHTYALTDAVNLIVETGWTRGQGFRKSVWSRRLVDKAGDAWQGALGVIYRF